MIMECIISPKYVRISMWKVYNPMMCPLAQQNRIQPSIAYVRNLLRVIWSVVIMKTARINGFITPVWIWTPEQLRKTPGFVQCVHIPCKSKNIVKCFSKESRISLIDECNYEVVCSKRYLKDNDFSGNRRLGISVLFFFDCKIFICGSNSQKWNEKLKSTAISTNCEWM